MMRHGIFALSWLAGLASAVSAQGVLVEAESFRDPGGWSLDTQFISIMGSPYLLAHGLGTPVKDARTKVRLPGSGRYRVWVRTKDWVARWKAPGAPGRFRVLIDGVPLKADFGTSGAEWHWQDGGEVQVEDDEVVLLLQDLTGFDGRCDAIFFSPHPGAAPPERAAELAPWRRARLGLPPEPPEEDPFDVVVVGGGYAGIAAAVSAGRLGCRVALLQDRPVLGGNGSSEVRVWSQGGIRTGLYPKLGEIVEEFMDRAGSSPGPGQEFGDDRKEALVRAEPDVALRLHRFVFAADARDGRLRSVTALDTRTGAEIRYVGRLFVDATGHGTVGALAGADLALQEKGHLGMSNMWRWTDRGTPCGFPDVSWALPLDMKDFPYPHRGKGEWFWESGFDRHPIDDLEYMRDWNLRAVFGAFGAMKNGDGRAKHAGAALEWVAYIGGTRESRQLLGDVVLTRDDIQSKKAFPDGCVPTTWDIDLHYPRKEFAAKFPDDPFISKAVFDRSVDRKHGYPVPFRCLYSRNIANLFMAGRCVSVTHEALGTVRVQRTGGMMGEVVGKAAALCVRHGCTPRDVFASRWEDLKRLLDLPGATRKDVAHGRE